MSDSDPHCGHSSGALAYWGVGSIIVQCGMTMCSPSIVFLL